MGLVLVYLPYQRENLSEASLWEQLRAWMKAEGLSWEKLRLTPDFFQKGQVQRTELQATLELVRSGQITRVVYASLDQTQRQSLDWLAFALTLKRYHIPLESLEEGVIPLEAHLQKLTQGFDQLHLSSKTRSRKVQKSI